MNEYKDHLESIVERDKRNLVVIQEEYNKPFEYADRLEKLSARKRELTEMLYKKDNNINSEEPVINEKEKITNENRILQNSTEDKKYYISDNSVGLRR